MRISDWSSDVCSSDLGGFDFAHGTTAPFFRLSAWLGTTSSGSNSSRSPSPSHAGQAPCGALKLNSRGSISAMVKPETGQANFSEKMMRLAGIPTFFIAVRPELVEGPSCSSEGKDGASTSSARTELDERERSEEQTSELQSL